MSINPDKSLWAGRSARDPLWDHTQARGDFSQPQLQGSFRERGWDSQNPGAGSGSPFPVGNPRKCQENSGKDFLLRGISWNDRMGKSSGWGGREFSAGPGEQSWNLGCSGRFSRISEVKPFLWDVPFRKSGESPLLPGLGPGAPEPRKNRSGGIIPEFAPRTELWAHPEPGRGTRE